MWECTKTTWGTRMFLMIKIYVLSLLLSLIIQIVSIGIIGKRAERYPGGVFALSVFSYFAFEQIIPALLGSITGYMVAVGGSRVIRRKNKASGTESGLDLQFLPITPIGYAGVVAPRKSSGHIWIVNGFKSMLGLGSSPVCGISVKEDPEKSNSKIPFLLALSAFMIFTIFLYWKCINTAEEAIAISANNSEVHWRTFAAQGDANKFVFDTYRPCLEPTMTPSLTRQDLWLKGAFKIERKNQLDCKAQTLKAAIAAKGEIFGADVASAIEKWEGTDRRLDPEDQKRFDKAVEFIRVDNS